MKHLTLFLQSNFESAIYCCIDPFLTIFLVPKIYKQTRCPFSAMTFSRAIPSAQPPYWLACWAVAWWVVMRVSRFGCSTWDAGDSGGDIHRASQHFNRSQKKVWILIKRSCILIVARLSWKVKLSQGIWVESMKHDLFPQSGESFDETKDLKSSTCQAVILIFLNLGHHN